MKVTLITVCFNSAATLSTAIDSVLSQKGIELEYIVVDGNSKDGTVDLIKSYESKFNGRMRWISEPDKGMYDAINKGIKMATGDIVGILNADDVLASDDTLAQIVEQFEPLNTRNARKDGERVDCVYADIRFVKEGESVEALRGAPTVRYCSAKRWRPWMFRFAAMVPHPSFYVRRECFARQGLSRRCVEW